MSAHVLGLHVNPDGGVPKHPVSTLGVTKVGCLGDKQNDLKHHGGPQRAVCLMLESVMEMLQQSGHPIRPGTTGENVLIGGLQPDDIEIGSSSTFSSGVKLQITGPAPPCKTIQASFLDGQFTALSHKLDSHQTRWYALVIDEGTLGIGEDVHVVNES